VAQTIRGMRMTLAVNALGLPAVALPVGIAQGLPQAVQVIGPRYREDLCLDAAAALEDRVGMWEEWQGLPPRPLRFRLDQWEGSAGRHDPGTDGACQRQGFAPESHWALEFRAASGDLPDDLCNAPDSARRLIPCSIPPAMTKSAGTTVAR
jgi:Amidase